MHKWNKKYNAKKECDKGLVKSLHRIQIVGSIQMGKNFIIF